MLSTCCAEARPSLPSTKVSTLRTPATIATFRRWQLAKIKDQLGQAALNVFEVLPFREVWYSFTEMVKLYKLGVVFFLVLLAFHSF